MPRLQVRIQPGARRTGFVGWYGELPKLAVTAPPVDGAANESAVLALADQFRVHPRQVRLVSGARSRNKRFEIDGLTADELATRLFELNPRSE